MAANRSVYVVPPLYIVLFCNKTNSFIDFYTPFKTFLFRQFLVLLKPLTLSNVNYTEC